MNHTQPINKRKFFYYLFFSSALTRDATSFLNQRQTLFVLPSLYTFADAAITQTSSVHAARNETAIHVDFEILLPSGSAIVLIFLDLNRVPNSDEVTGNTSFRLMYVVRLTYTTFQYFSSTSVNRQGRGMQKDDAYVIRRGISSVNLHLTEALEYTCFL